MEISLLCGWLWAEEFLGASSEHLPHYYGAVIEAQSLLLTLGQTPLSEAALPGQGLEGARKSRGWGMVVEKAFFLPNQEIMHYSKARLYIIYTALSP